MTGHALYRFYSDDGQLLYVGITNNPGNRFNQHQHTKAWWKEVRGISIEHYPTRRDAEAAEHRAIQVEGPRYNIRKRRPVKRSPRGNNQTLIWICDICGQPIADKQGDIYVDRRTVPRPTTCDRSASWEPVNLSTIKPLAQWRAQHYQCQIARNTENDYGFDVSRARTTAALFAWTLHLMEKTWINQTDWRHFAASSHVGDHP